MSALFKSVMTLILLGCAYIAAAGADAPSRPFEGQADLCYRETLAAAAGTAPQELSTAACARALRQMPLDREDQSIVLYNRGLIERAQGRDDAARNSFARAVLLSRNVDMRNLALAQQAHKQGDYVVAVEQYKLILESPIAAKDVQKYRDRIRRSKASAMLSLGRDSEVKSTAMTTRNTD